MEKSWKLSRTNPGLFNAVLVFGSQLLIITCSNFYFQVNTAMVPQSHQHPALKGISVRMAQNLPHSIHAGQVLTTTSRTKLQSLHVSCVIQESTVKAMHGCGPMTTVMKVSSALVDHGLNVQETLVLLIMIMQQALLTAVTQYLSACAQHGTKPQVE